MTGDLSGRIEEILTALANSAAGDVDGARQLAMAIRPTFKRQERAKRGSIGRSKMMEIFLRDGFVDQYTGERLLFPGTLLLLGKLIPEVFRIPEAGKGWRVAECHWMYWRLWPTVDHLDPVSRGGHNNSLDRLITTSQMVNSARGPWTLEEVPAKMRIDLADPAQCRAQRWDGMMRWFLDYVEKHPERLEADEIRGWKKAADAATKTDEWKQLVGR